MPTKPEIIPITSQSFAAGTGTARDSAIQQQANMDQRQTLINQAGKGKGNKNKKYRGGSSDKELAVPQFHMQYTPTGGPGTSPNDQVAQGAVTYTQSNANAEYDNQASIMGGRKRYRKGGNQDWKWGCYSGGRTKRHKKSKSKKHKKKTRRRRRY